MMEQSPPLKAAKIRLAKNLAKLSQDEKKKQKKLRHKKQVGYFRMPDAPETKEGKGKAKDTREWGPCPLLPGVPTVPPPHVPQPWELKRLHVPVPSTAESCLSPEKKTISPARTPPRTKKRKLQFSPSTVIVQSAEPPESPVEVVEVCPKIEFLGFTPSCTTSPNSGGSAYEIVTVPSTVESCLPPEEKTTSPARTPPRTKKRELQFSPSTVIVQSAEPPESPVEVVEVCPNIEYLGFTPSCTTSPNSGGSAYEIVTVPLTVESCLPPEEKTTSPARTPPRTKKRELQFSPSTVIVQSAEPPESPVEVCPKIEFLGFTPSCTTLKTTPNSGGSAYEIVTVPSTVESCLPPEEKTTSPARTPPRTKKRKLQFSPSTVIVQSAEPPESPVEVCPKIEFLGFTPPCTTSKTTPNSGGSAYEIVTVPSTVESCFPPEEKTISPARTPPRTKKRKLQFSPSTVIVQNAEPPESPIGVCAEIEFVGFTPLCTTSKTTPNSGGSAYEIDIENIFVEPGEGSDVEPEPEENLGITLRQRYDQEYPDLETLEDLSLAKAICQIDYAADSALRTVVGPEQDLLHFDWQSDPEYFEGVREEFTVPSTGPTFPNAELTPLEVFLKIWDADIIAHIVRETNRYGGELKERNKTPQSRMSRWKDVTDDDIRKYFAILMLQALVVNNVEREYWYPKLEEIRIGDFRAIMPYNRFLVIKRCLHFVDNASLPEHPNRLDKIMPIIEHLNKKFSSLYVLEQNVAIDESLLLWKGRLSFSQKIATKKARVGIKSYELCESRTGYLWRMEVYSGKGHEHVAQVAAPEPVEEHEEGGEPEGATSQIVLTLMRPLFNRGHTVVMDNFYNSPLLSRVLKVKHKTDSMGTLRLYREFVPEGLKTKDKKNMMPGEVAYSMTKDLSVVVWMDRSVVAMISTFHRVQVGGKEKHGNYKYKPQVILDYNMSMGGIDHKDQMLHAYPLERTRNLIWYKKLFRRLLNVSIHNAFVMFNHNRTQGLGNRDFRLQLAKGLLQMCSPRPLAPVAPAAPATPVAPATPSQMHLPAKNERRQRCKLCYAAKVCRTTVWRCSTCAVNLCIEGCYTAYHQKLYTENVSPKKK